MKWFELLKQFLESLNKNNSLPKTPSPIPTPLPAPFPAPVVTGKMVMSRKGKMFLAGLEGICLTKYLDSVGVWTIGVGATKSEIPDLASWPKDKALTIQECFSLLDKSLKKYEKAVDDALKVDVTQEQYDALVSICYNIGTGGLTKSTFMKRINALASVGYIPSLSYLFIDTLEFTRTHSYPYIKQEESGRLWGANSTVVDAIMMWDKPKEIIGRRTKEATLFSKGIYAGGGKANLFPVSSSGRPLYSQGKIIDLNLYI